MLSFPILELLQDCEDPPLTRQLLKEIEIALGVKFPTDYADFLLQFNGGTFTRPVMFFVPDSPGFPEGVSIVSFLGKQGRDGSGRDLKWCAKTLADRIPENYLAIAHCNSEDYVLLKFSTPAFDSAGIWFWDGPGFWIPEDGDNILWLADSFNEFLSMLQYDTYCDDEDRETIPLFLAVEHGNRRAIEQYLSEGGDVEACNEQGHTLLTAAAIYQWPKIVRLLLEHSANPMARDKLGRTPLHHAATSSIDSVKLLLSAGADAKARDNDGKSVLGEWSYRADQILRLTERWNSFAAKGSRP